MFIYVPTQLIRCDSTCLYYIKRWATVPTCTAPWYNLEFVVEVKAEEALCGIYLPREATLGEK